MRPPITSAQPTDRVTGSSNVMSDITTAPVPIDQSRAPSPASRDPPVPSSSHFEIGLATNPQGLQPLSELSTWIASLTIGRSPPRPMIDMEITNDTDMHDRSMEYTDITNVLRDTLDSLDGIHREGVINDLEMSCIDYSPQKDVD